MQKLDFKKLILSVDSSIKDAMKQLNQVPEKIIFIVDHVGKLFGTITDGDIRRGILNGIGAIINATKGEYKSTSLKGENFQTNEFILFLALMLYVVLPIFAYLILFLFCIQILGFPFGLIAGIGLVIILGIIRQIFFSSIFGQTLSGRGGYLNNNGFFGGGFSSGGFGGGFSGGGGSFGGGGASGGW